jgi:hypothetical protein
MSFLSSYDTSKEFRFRLVVRVTCLFFIIGIVMSSNLWISNRLFPIIPAFDINSTFPVIIDSILYYGLIVSLGLILVFPRPSTGAFSIGLLLVLLLQDQMRWQPWVYMYVLFILPLIFMRKRDHYNLAYFQIILIGIYIWGGVHKLNPAFLDSTFYSITKGFFQIQDELILQQIRPFGYLIPIGEIIMGCMLIFPKYRKTGVTIAIASHFFILVYLSPFGIDYNPIVYPWNVAMIVIVLLLFDKNPNPIRIWNYADWRSSILNTLAVLLLWIMPLFNYWGKWDHYLSFSLYSGRTSYFYIGMESESTDPNLAEYSAYFEALQGEYIDVNLWSLTELGVPFYPEKRVFDKLIEHYCKNYSMRYSMIFIEKDPPYDNPNHIVFTCKQPN